MSETNLQPLGNPLRMRPIYTAIAVIAVLSALGAGYAYSWNQSAAPSGRGFTDADVAKVEQSIKTEFARRSGLSVSAVKMIKESPTRLTGVADIRTPSLGTVQKACEATLGNRGQPIWECN